MAQLSTASPCVVVIDQLDAISQTLSRDQTTLSVVLTTLARLREMSGVLILASCRTFDLRNDPRLSSVKVDHTFQLEPLHETQNPRGSSSHQGRPGSVCYLPTGGCSKHHSTWRSTQNLLGRIHPVSNVKASGLFKSCTMRSGTELLI